MECKTRLYPRSAGLLVAKGEVRMKEGFQGTRAGLLAGMVMGAVVCGGIGILLGISVKDGLGGGFWPNLVHIPIALFKGQFRELGTWFVAALGLLLKLTF